MKKRFIVIFGILLLLLMPFIYADVAPFGYSKAVLNFLVKYDNQTIEEDFGADILVCSEEGCKSDMADWCVQGICTFPYYRIERVPSEMRLQVSLHDKTFTSGTFNFSEKRPLHEYYYDVNINPDGKMTITGGWKDNGEIEQNGDYPVEETWWESYYPLLRIFVCALVLTILIELIVLILFLRRWKVKGWKRPILSLVLADIISVPLVWIILICLVALLSEILISIVIAEAFAVVFEAFFIYWLNKKVISLKRLLILSIVMNIASLVIGGIALAVLSSAFTDSERIVQDQLKEKEFKFDAFEYPLVIDKNKYPELSAFENDLSMEYGLTLQNFAEGFKEYGYECFVNPAVSKLSFNYLKPKQNLYLIESYCGVPGEISPYSGMPNIMFYARQGGIVMFYRKYAASHFTEAFNNIENLDELKEYSELYVDNLDKDLYSALNNSLLSYSSSEDFEKDCPLVSDIPKLSSTVSKEGNGFVYEGLKIEPEIHAILYYLKYDITSDGQVIKDKDEMLALCENMGIIY